MSCRLFDTEMCHVIFGVEVHPGWVPDAHQSLFVTFLLSCIGEKKYNEIRTGRGHSQITTMGNTHLEKLTEFITN